MTAPGGGDPFRDQWGPWPQYQHPPVDPQPPLNYPEYPYTGPQPAQPPPYSPVGYGGPPPPPYGGPMPMYYPYQPQSQRTNSLAVASLVTSIAGVVFGIPLAVLCFVGLLIPVIGAVLGGIALSQIKQSGEQGRGMAIAGVAIGAATTALLVLVLVLLTAAAFHSPTFIH